MKRLRERDRKRQMGKEKYDDKRQNRQRFGRERERERIRGKIGDKRTDYTLCNQLRVIGKGDYTTRNQ